MWNDGFKVEKEMKRPHKRRDQQKVTLDKSSINGKWPIEDIVGN